MIFEYLMKPGVKIKKCVFVGFIGTILFSLGIGEIIIHRS